jgi:hypothetical protein
LALSGHRHRLVLYTYILNRLWRLTFSIGLLLVAMVAAIGWLPSILPHYVPVMISEPMLWTLGGMGVYAILLSVFLAAIRKSAYVRPFDTHLRLVTPFLAMNISYQRFVQASSSEMGRLFYVENLKGLKLDFLRPLGGQTAIVIELESWPLPRRVLELFLSPYFFPDKTARLAVLVPDWMKFSNELESFRSRRADSIHKQAENPQAELLASLSWKE